MGNVAEMTSKKGVAKGGGWIHEEESIGVKTDIPYQKTASWLGFRCVLVTQ